MAHTKILGYIAPAANVVTCDDLRAYLAGHGCDVADHLRELDVHPDAKNTGAVFCCQPTFATARFLLDAVPGITIFDPHTSPTAISKAHAALLKAHGVLATDTPWLAQAKICASLGLTGTQFDPRA